MGSTWSTFYPPKSKFSVNDIPDLSGKVMIVTGSYSGIGKEVVKALLEHNATVYVVGRSVEKAEAAIEDLHGATGRKAKFLLLDLASLKSVRRAAESFLSKETSLHAIFDNAGILSCPIELLTEEGYDLQFGTHVLAQRDGVPSRIIINSSIMGLQVNPEMPIDFDTLKDGPARRKKTSMQLYSQSKFASVILAQELARRYAVPENTIIAISLDPGNIKSNLQRYLPSYVRFILNHLFFYPPSMGALTPLYAGTSPEALKLNGKYLVAWARVGKPHPRTSDTELGEKLWNWLEEQVKGM